MFVSLYLAIGWLMPWLRKGSEKLFLIWGFGGVDFWSERNHFLSDVPTMRFGVCCRLMTISDRHNVI